VSRVEVLIPVYNEVKNLEPLVREFEQLNNENDQSFQLLFIDDGSTDGSREMIEQIVESSPDFSAVYLVENCGKSNALTAGVQHSTAPILGMMDADGQDDPRDLPRLYEALEDVDLVVGYRKNRKDAWHKKLASMIANRVRNWVTLTDIKDAGCGVRLMHRAVFEEIVKFVGFHRFIPTLAEMKGFKWTQIPVNNRPRKHGKSKYTNLGRLKKTVWDLLAVRWMQQRKLTFEVEKTDRE